VPVIETSLGRLAEPDGDRVEFTVRTDVPTWRHGASLYQSRRRWSAGRDRAGS
jgi:hypothetical protein